MPACLIAHLQHCEDRLTEMVKDEGETSTRLGLIMPSGNRGHYSHHLHLVREAVRGIMWLMFDRAAIESVRRAKQKIFRPPIPPPIFFE